MVPSGFERLLLGHAVAVARSDIAPAIRRALIGADGAKVTLHEFAARQSGARALQGRGAAYAIALPQTALRVVVRHNRRGGLMARITADRFLSPTRAPYELEVSLALRGRGVATPEILAYVLYPPGGLVQRSDVCSVEVSPSRDLTQLLGAGETERASALAATARLLAALSRAGARHHDLNARNVLVSADSAYVLDVDRVALGVSPESALEGNLSRLARSLRKLRERAALRVSEQDVRELETRAREALRA